MSLSLETHYATLIYDFFVKGNREKCVHDLSYCIGNIDGVPVESQLIYTKIPITIDLQLRVKRVEFVSPEEHWDTIQLLRGGPEDQLSPDVVLYALQYIRNNTIKLNMYDGCFYDTNKSQSLWNAGISFFGTAFQDNDDCCICLEKTMTKTNCEHFLCVRCWAKLKKARCPMCRQPKIYMYDSDEESEDGDYDE